MSSAYLFTINNLKCPANQVYLNTSMFVSVLRDDFRTEPKNTTTAVGDRALLQCGPPKGTPDPVIRWKKNGEIINLELFDR